MRLAFLDLPDDRVDLISLASRTPSVEIVLVVHSDPEALALEIAEVLQIPRSAEPLDLLSLKPDQVALPSLDAPGATVLLRSGISERIFTSLDEIQSRLKSPAAPQPPAAPNRDIPIEDGDSAPSLAAPAGNATEGHGLERGAFGRCIGGRRRARECASGVGDVRALARHP